jgi:propanol-preferring alcohol dehydrogenase
MRFAHFQGNGVIRIEEIEKPSPEVDEVLLKVDSCAICGSEKEFFLKGTEDYKGTRNIIGHEVSGTVVGKGESTKIPEGTRGIVLANIYCGRCSFCQKGLTNMCHNGIGSYGFSFPGGYAEYMAVKERCFLPINKNISLEEGVLLLDTIGVPAHALRKVNAENVKTAAVFGCGPIGLGAISVMRAFGVSRIYAVEAVKYRLLQAQRLGAEPVDINQGNAVTQIKEKEKFGVDLALEAVGNPLTQKQALDIVDINGKVIFIGHGPKLEMDPNVLILKNVSLLGSWYFPINEFKQNQDLIIKHKIDPKLLISHKFPLARLSEAFNIFLKGETAKVLIKCQE